MNDIGVDVSAGDVASLSGHADISLEASVGIGATLGIDLAPLGQGVSVDGHALGSPGAVNVLISHLPTWHDAVESAASGAIAADQMLGTSGNADMLVRLRDGTVAAIEFVAGNGTNQSFVVTKGGASQAIAGTGAGNAATLGDFLLALEAIDPAHLDARYNTATYSMRLHDTTAPVATTPQSIGISSGLSASASQIGAGLPHAGEYQAVLTATPPKEADYTTAMDLVLVVGTLPTPSQSTSMRAPARAMLRASPPNSTPSCTR